MNPLQQAWAVARKDLAVEFRTKESLNAAGAFSIAILLLFSFTLDVNSEETRDIAGGLLWLAFAFAGALIFNRGFARELPNECLDTLLASPLSAASLVTGKAIATFAMLLVVELLSLFVLGIFYNVQWWIRLSELVAVFSAATWGISVVGAVFGALTVNLRLREVMLPVIIYPLLIPLLIAAIELTKSLFVPGEFSDMDWLWVKVLTVFDIVFTSLAILLADTILVN